MSNIFDLQAGDTLPQVPKGSNQQMWLLWEVSLICNYFTLCSMVFHSNCFQIDLLGAPPILLPVWPWQKGDNNNKAVFIFKTMLISLKQHPEYRRFDKTVLCFDCQTEWVVFVTFIPCLRNILKRSFNWNWRLDNRDNREGNAPLLNEEGSFLPGPGLEDYVE